MLMKLTPAANFTNILQSAFLYKSVLISFSVLTFRFVIFWHKESGTKAALKLLMKLTPGWPATGLWKEARR